MRNVIHAVFTRHELDKAQRAALPAAQTHIDFKDEAARVIKRQSDVEAIIVKMHKVITSVGEYFPDLAGTIDEINLFGVFPPIMLQGFKTYYVEYFDGITINIWQNWNTDRAAEGEEPRFAFKAWVRTEVINNRVVDNFEESQAPFTLTKAAKSNILKFG